jgi:hypothetical protein
MTVPTSGPTRLGWFVKQGRRQRRLSQVAAAKLAGISRQAWIDLEAGIRDSYDTTFQGVEDALRWQSGSCAAIRDGGQPTELPDPVHILTRAERAELLIEFAHTDPKFTSEPTLARALIDLAEAAIREERGKTTTD